uniref:Uncharacterized protein n=1 Tax=Eutreptiella gymnastica TaxID=73025 RepID=A0A7S1I6K1_9EUGL
MVHHSFVHLRRFFLVQTKQKLRRSEPGNQLLFPGSRKPPMIHCCSACTTLVIPIFRQPTQKEQSCEAAVQYFTKGKRRWQANKASHAPEDSSAVVVVLRGGNTENSPSPSANMGHLLSGGSSTEKMTHHVSQAKSSVFFVFVCPSPRLC